MGNELSNTPSHNCSRRLTIIDRAQSPLELHKRQTKSNYLRHWTVFTNLHLGGILGRTAKWYNKGAWRIARGYKLPISEQNSTKCLSEVQRKRVRKYLWMMFDRSDHGTVLSMQKHNMQTDILSNKFRVSRPCDKSQMSLRIQQSVSKTT